MTVPRVVLQPRRARPFYGRHPWVFAGAIASVAGNPADGDEVELVSHAEHFVARGLYNSRSKIRVRLYSWERDIHVDQDLFRQRLAQAIHLRHNILNLAGPGRAYRLVFSEADGLSGCTVDRYDRWLVMQFTSLGLGQRREILADLLQEMLQLEGTYLRTERGMGQMEGLELEDGLLRGRVPVEPIVIDDDGLRFLVHVAEGQKTGFYLDQRDNRRTVAMYCRGRRVLDVFCYTGGFGLHAARAGASQVIGVDASEPAVALARENARINGLHSVRSVRADVFDHLDELVRAGERFGVVILDPPKFARNRSAVAEAMKGYRRLHQLAFRLLEPSGILVTCCCSGLITAEMLETLLSQIAAEERRETQILEVRGPSADHPVAVACPESRYLKCLISHVS